VVQTSLNRSNARVSPSIPIPSKREKLPTKLNGCQRSYTNLLDCSGERVGRTRTDLPLIVNVEVDPWLRSREVVSPG
jgi:hypothetical protein